MTPLATVILMAGLSSIPTDLSDQAKADGARYFRALFQVKLPLILPIMLNSLLFSFIFTFGDLTVVYVLTRGGPINHTLTLPMYSFLVGIDGGNLSQGTAIALFISPVLLAVEIVLLRTASRAQVRWRSAQPRARKPPAVRHLRHRHATRSRASARAASSRARSTPWPCCRAAAVLLFCIVAAAPFVVMGITTFQTDRDLYKRDASPFDYAEPPTLEHLDNLFNDTNYLVFIRNSLVVGAAVVAITLLLALPAAYSLARLTGRWGERAGILMFIVYLVPPTLLFIPLFRIIVALGLSNSLLSLIVVYPTITVPFSAWLLMGFFKSIPPETEEAALVDGYHPYGAFLHVALPLARPGIISVIVFSFTLTLHEFIYALVFITRSEWRTLSVGVPSELILGDVFFWQPLLASALIIAIPVDLVYNLFLDRLIQGFTAGAVKG